MVRVGGWIRGWVDRGVREVGVVEWVDRVG